MNPRHLEVFDILHPRFLLVVERKAYDIEAFCMIFVVGSHHVRHFGLAGSAPRSPEVNEHPFALAYILAQLVHVTVYVSFFQIRELLSDEGILLLVSRFLLGKLLQLGLYEWMVCPSGFQVEDAVKFFLSEKL